MRRAPWLPVPLLLLGALAAARAAPEGRPGEMFLSDGTVVRGQVRFTPGIRLRFFVPERGERLLVDPADLVRLEAFCESESMERPWTFKNPGDPTKTYGEGEYPLRNLGFRLTVRGGDVHWGTLTSTVVYVTPEGSEEETRYKVVRQQKGRVGETLDDLVYVQEIRWLDVEEAGWPPGRIEGALDLDGRLEDVAALHRERGRVHRGRVTDERAGAFVIDGLPEGTFDLFLETSRAFVHPYGPLPASAPEDAADAVLASDLGPVREATNLASDFFEERHVVALDGTRAAARALVLKDRVGATSYEGELQGEKMWRLEVWLWHRLETEWRLDRRLFLFRGRRAPDEAARVPRFEEGLGGLAVRAGGILEVASPPGDGDEGAPR